MLDALCVDPIPTQILASLRVELRDFLSNESKPDYCGDKKEAVKHTVPWSIWVVVAIAKSSDCNEGEVKRRDYSEVGRRAIRRRDCELVREVAIEN